MLVKRSAFALAFLFILYILENIILGIISWQFNYDLGVKIQNFFPLKSMYKLIDEPISRLVGIVNPGELDLNLDYAVHWHELVIVICWTALFVFLSYRLLKKRDL